MSDALTTPQRVLDETRVFRVPAYRPDAPLIVPTPLFLDSDVILAGDGPRSILNGYTSGAAVVVGIPRGDIDDGHYPGDCFRTCGDSHLWAIGDHWALGPEGGFVTVTTLTIRMRATRHGRSWEDSGLCGTQGGTGYDAPHPWHVAYQLGCLILVVRTSDGVVRRFTTPAADTPELDFEWVVDLDAGTVGCRLGGVDSPTEPAGTPLPPGSRLAENDDAIWGFSVGRIGPAPAAEGFPFGSWLDMSIHALEVDYGGGRACKLWPGPRPDTYPGGPSLPLVYASGPAGGRYMTAHPRGGQASASRVLIRDLTITPYSLCVGVLVGGVQGGLTLERVNVVGGSRGLSSMMAAVAYPVRIAADCVFQAQTDCGVFLWRSTQSTIDAVQFKYSGRVALHLVGCNLDARNVMEAPGGPPSPFQTVIQDGGDCSYRRVGADYEYDTHPDYRMIRVRPRTWDLGHFPTRARIDNCSFRSVADEDRNDNIVAVSRWADNYAGRVEVVVDGRTVWAKPSGAW